MPIRVLVAGLKPLLCRIVSDAISAQPDMQVLQPAELEMDLTAERMATFAPDVMIVPPSMNGSATTFEAAVQLIPGVRLLEIGGPSDRFLLRIVEVNPDERQLVDAIRETVGRSLSGTTPD